MTAGLADAHTKDKPDERTHYARTLARTNGMKRSTSLAVKQLKENLRPSSSPWKEERVFDLLGGGLYA